MIFNLLYKGSLKKPVKIYGYPLLKIERGSKIECGNRLTLVSDSFFSEPGVYHPCIIRIAKNAILKIGDDVGMSGVTICVHEGVSIGSQVLLGSNVIITDSDFHPITKFNRIDSNVIVTRKVIISDNVFIGMNSIVLKGVHIGRNSIIGAGSIVTKDIPEDVIAAGVPAKIVSSIKSS